MIATQEVLSTPNETMILRNFENHEIEFIDQDDQTWITADGLAKGLELFNSRAIHTIYSRHKEVIEPFSVIVKMTSTDGKKYDKRVFNQTGALAIILFSRSPKAAPFQKWVLEVIDEIRRTGSYSLDEDFRKNVLDEMQKLRQEVSRLQLQKLQLPQMVVNMQPTCIMSNFTVHFALNPQKSFSVKEVQDIPYFNEVPHDTLYKYMTRLMNRRVIIRVGTGQYQLNPYYQSADFGGNSQ